MAYCVTILTDLTAEYIVRGFAAGFDIGFRGQIHPSEPRNLMSASQRHQRPCQHGHHKRSQSEATQWAHFIITSHFSNLHISPSGGC